MLPIPVSPCEVSDVVVAFGTVEVAIRTVKADVVETVVWIVARLSDEVALGEVKSHGVVVAAVNEAAIG